jgi:hypothetical protein
MAMSSQFYRDMSKIEKKIWGISIRQLKAYALLAGVSVVIGIETFLLPDWAFYLVTLPTAFILGAYPVYLLLNRWTVKRRKIELSFLIEERTYTTGQIRRYEKHEFTQSKEIKETDSI